LVAPLTYWMVTGKPVSTAAMWDASEQAIGDA
jgi:hypothetical protein